jgi:tyrosine-specific transport protein
MKNSISKIITASLMVSGVSIGIGILGLPVDTGLAGFFPSLIIMLISWLFMLATGWIIARQISETQNDKEDLGGLFKRTLGKSGTILSNIGYLFLLYCILIAHIVGGSQILNSLGFLSLPIWVFVLLFFIIPKTQ